MCFPFYLWLNRHLTPSSEYMSSFSFPSMPLNSPLYHRTILFLSECAFMRYCILKERWKWSRNRKICWHECKDGGELSERTELDNSQDKTRQDKNWFYSVLRYYNHKFILSIHSMMFKGETKDENSNSRIVYKGPSFVQERSFPYSTAMACQLIR